MGKPKSEDAIKARKLYEEGKSLKEIAEILKRPDGTVRRWKSVHNWDNISNEQRKASVRKKKEVKASVDSVLENNELTSQEQEFCLLYANTPNATAAYQKAFKCSYNNARQKSWKLMRRIDIKHEIKELKKIKFESMLFEVEDLVELNMRIAFADMGSFVEWGTTEVPVMAVYGPVMIKNEQTGKKEVLTKTINQVLFKGSDNVDSTIVDKVKVGKDGASIELTGRDKAIEWLSKYFEAFPADKHRREYEQRKLAIELARAEASLPLPTDTTEDDGFLKALNEEAAEIWTDNEGDDINESAENKDGEQLGGD